MSEKVSVFAGGGLVKACKKVEDGYQISVLSAIGLETITSDVRAKTGDLIRFVVSEGKIISVSVDPQRKAA